MARFLLSLMQSERGAKPIPALAMLILHPLHSGMERTGREQTHLTPLVAKDGTRKVSMGGAMVLTLCVPGARKEESCTPKKAEVTLLWMSRNK